jgi:hypothetical protein
MRKKSTKEPKNNGNIVQTLPIASTSTNSKSSKNAKKSVNMI